MIKKLTTLALFLTLICSGASAAIDDPTTIGMTEGTSFYYAIDVGTGATPTSYQTAGRAGMLIDIGLKPSPDPLPAGDTPTGDSQSELMFKFLAGFLGDSGANDVVIDELRASPALVEPGTTTTLIATIQNDNSCDVTDFTIDFRIIFQDGFTTFNCPAPAGPNTILANSSASFACTSEVLNTEGRYDTSAQISGVSFSETGCADTPVGNVKTTSFIVAQVRSSLFAIPEINLIAVVALALIVLAVASSKR